MNKPRGSDATPEAHVEPIDLAAAFRQYGPYVARIATRLLGRPDEVDDCVQQVFLAATKGIDALRDPRALKGWLAQITVRTARKRLHRRKLMQFVYLDDPEEHAVVVAKGATAEETEFIAKLYRFLDTLPVDERTAWTLRYLEEEDLQSVADLGGYSLATAKRKIARAQELLDRMLGEAAKS